LLVQLTHTREPSLRTFSFSLAACRSGFLTISRISSVRFSPVAARSGTIVPTTFLSIISAFENPKNVSANRLKKGDGALAVHAENDAVCIFNHLDEGMLRFAQLAEGFSQFSRALGDLALEGTIPTAQA
jgi:hypothetical protein